MINTLKPGASGGNTEVKDEGMKKFLQKYGAPDEKPREAVKKLGKDEFFKLMITQIQHQDPLKPYQNDEMAAQMAQFSALEQMVNVNTNLEKLTQSQQPLQQLSASHLIGKFVTVDSSRVLHTEGKESEVRFDLPAEVQKVHVSIINERGENIRDLEAGKMPTGPASISWDGKGSNGLAAKSGTYMVQIAAENDRGKSIPVTTQKTDRVHGVNFDGKEVILLTGEISKPGKVFLREVSKVIDGNPMQSQKPQAQAAPAFGGPQSPEGLAFPAENLEGLDDETRAAIQQAMEAAMAGGGAAGAAAGAASGAAPGQQMFTDEDIKRAISASDGKPMQDYVPGKMSKFTSVDPKMFNGSAAQKPEPEIKRTVDPDDLTAANPSAEAIQSGQGQENVGDLNPAAMEYYRQNGLPMPKAQPAVAGKSFTGQSQPASAEGSVAGQWTE